MKKIIFLMSLLIAAAVVSYGQSAGDHPGSSSGTVKSVKLFISLAAGKLSINKVELSKNWKLAPVVSVLGSGGRTREGVNSTHSYDAEGIVLFEKILDKRSTGEISEVQVYFSEGEKNNVTPTGYYTGKLEIEKKQIDIDLPLEKLRNILWEYTESNSYSPHNYRFAKNGIYLYVQYDDDDLEIRKVSFGKDTRGNN